MKKEELEEFVEGIFFLNTRRFGKVAELMIQKLYGFKNPDNNSYDLLAANHQKIEVKFSRGLKKCKKIITSENLIEQVLNATYENRILTYEQAKDVSFDCNIQQIKPSCFDMLYYGCFFEDKIMICKISSKELMEEKGVNYSDKQHRGNKGEGQFHIHKNKLIMHFENHFVQWLTYEELFEMFNTKKES